MDLVILVFIQKKKKRSLRIVRHQLYLEIVFHLYSGRAVPFTFMLLHELTSIRELRTNLNEMELKTKCSLPDRLLDFGTKRNKSVF